MRIKTSLWVKSYIRTCFTKGAHCAVVHKGDGDAGQVFIKSNHLDGAFSLYGPAPLMQPQDGLERQFEAKSKGGVTEEEVEKIIDSQREFDPDIWVVEIESKGGEVFLEELDKEL